MNVKKNAAETVNPISNKRLVSIRRKFVVFSIFLFLLVFLPGTWVFIFSMRGIIKQDMRNELLRIVELKRLKFEAQINSEIAVVLKMTDSPIIRNYIENPQDTLLRRLALGELAAYRRAVSSNLSFWVSNIDKKFYYNDEYAFTLDTSNSDFYWYHKTLYETEKFNFNINYDDLGGEMTFWINAPIFNVERKPVGVLGTGIELSQLLSIIYENYDSRAELYFFNKSGEIIGARDMNIAGEKQNIEKKLRNYGFPIMENIKKLEANEVKIFYVNHKGKIAISAVPELDLYIAASIPQTLNEYRTLLVVLYAAMSLVIMLVFVMFNLFVIKLLRPLQKMVEALSRVSTDWASPPSSLAERNDEVGVIAKCICEYLDKNRELTENVYHDTLTGVYSRRFLENNLERVIKSLSRSGGELSLLFIDIDNFKKYNDTYGHGEGDECLKAVAKTLAATLLRADDFVARYGGEEFVVVLPNTNEAGAKVVAESLLTNTLNQKIVHEKNDAVPFVSISIGITTSVVKHTQNGSDYIKKADEALYKSKQNGRNRYTFVGFED